MDQYEYIKEKVDDISKKLDAMFLKLDAVKIETVENSVKIRGLWAAVGFMPVLITVVLTIIFRLWK